MNGLTSLAEIGSISDRERLLEVACTAFESRVGKSAEGLRAMLTQQDLPTLQDLAYEQAWRAWPHLGGETFAPPNEVAPKLREGYENLSVPDDWDETRRIVFLNAVAEAVDRWRSEVLHESASESKDRFAGIERAARDLRRLVANLDGQSRALFEGAYDGVLSGSWDWAQRVPLASALLALDDLERAAYEAGEAIEPERGQTVRRMNERRLVRLVAKTYHAMFGEWPPASKGGWFAPFVRQLAGGVCGIDPGFDLIEAVIAEEKSG